MTKCLREGGERENLEVPFKVLTGRHKEKRGQARGVKTKR